MTTFTSEDRQAAQKEMNNKPIAWIWSEDGCNMGVCLDQDKQIGKQEFQDYSIPLYTHPAELTDEEIKEVWFALEHELGSHIKYGFAFARAILRKAQEK